MTAHADDTLNLEKLIKLMKMTTSTQDGEALTAIRMANGWLLRNGHDWETVLRGKITIIEDPFNAVNAPDPRRTDDDPYARRRRAAPPPPPQPQAKPQPQRPQAAPPGWQQNVNRPSPKQPVGPQLSFRKDTHGYWCIGSDQTLQMDSEHVVHRKDGTSQKVKITAYVQTDSYGNKLYRFVNVVNTTGGLGGIV